jgi:hypothetical protein
MSMRFHSSGSRHRLPSPAPPEQSRRESEGGGRMTSVMGFMAQLLGICFWRDAPETAGGADRRAGKRGLSESNRRRAWLGDGHGAARSRTKPHEALPWHHVLPSPHMIVLRTAFRERNIGLQDSIIAGEMKPHGTKSCRWPLDRAAARHPPGRPIGDE